jgi:serine/threonine-protein kinase HipA
LKKLEVRLRLGPGDERIVGTLAEQERRVYFEYSDDFLATGWELSPLHLKARKGLIEHTQLEFGPLPGLFDDSLPDGWGLLLMDRYLRKKGVDPDGLSALDRLQFLGTRTMGALTYHPPANPEPEDATPVDLRALAEGAVSVLRGAAPKILPELLKVGGSPQGARPKALVGMRGDEVIHGQDDLPEGFEHWLVKFLAQEDKPDFGRVELAYNRMAAAAGIDVPEARLFEVREGRRTHAYFGSKRFDRRPGNRRVHVHSLANLIQTNFRIPSRDYDDLFRATRLLTHGDHTAQLACFRRMVFNVAAHVRDDHTKNFAFVMNERGEWALSPAFDLAYAAGPGGEHQTTVAGEGREPTRVNCLELGERHGVRRREGERIIEKVNAAVSRWRKLAAEAGCRVATIRSIAKELRAL